jgi:lactoylglutathione lyase
MLNKVDYVMINVAQMPRSVAFYRDTLGIPLKYESPGWSEFQTGATTLALHLVPADAAENRPSQGPPAAGTCTIGFSVEDLDRSYAELQSRGARFVMPPTTRAEEGIRLAVCLDPDGLGISFAQPLPRKN